jgi:hypothetical protein
MDPLKKRLYSVQIKYENIGSPIKTVDINGKPAIYQPQKSIAIIDSKQVEGIASESEIFRNKIFRLIN